MISLHTSLVVCFACSLAYEFRPLQANNVCIPVYPNGEKEKIVLSTIKWPVQLAVSHKTENLYIVTMDQEFKVLRKGETEVEDIFMRELVNTIAVDNVEAKVYIGCSNGLKIYNEESRYVDDVEGWNQDTWQIFIPSGSSRIYAVFVRQFDLFIYDTVTSVGVNQHFSIAREAGRQFVADDEGNYFFNSKGSKITQVFQKGMMAPNQFKMNVTQFAIDNNGCAYGTAGDFLYFLKIQNNETQVIAKLDFHPVSLCFDKNNNLIFGTDNIFMLKNTTFDGRCNN